MIKNFLSKAKQASKIIKKTAIRTPLVYSPTISQLFGGEIYLKLENLQKTGSFKIRGAAHKIFKTLDKIEKNGVVAASAGNHAQGVALAAKEAGISATIVMPEWASISKQEATRNYGATLIIEGESLAESLIKAKELARNARTFVHPFDDPDVIIGQGTIGLEIIEDLKDADTVIVPIGGGGLISGIASVIKNLRPQTKIIGVQAAVCPSAFESRRKGKAIQVDAEKSIADGISVKQPGDYTFEIIEKYVDDIALVEEEHIAAAILMLLEQRKILAEGAGAVSLAALLNGSVSILPKKKTVLVISGGNVDSPLLGRIISQGLLKHGRIMRLCVELDDVPGALAKLLNLIAGLKANVLHIYHDRSVRHLPLYVTRVDLELETRGPAHLNEIAQSLAHAGYKVELK